jgi:hypothetical protein
MVMAVHQKIKSKRGPWGKKGCFLNLIKLIHAVPDLGHMRPFAS